MKRVKLRNKLFKKVNNKIKIKKIIYYNLKNKMNI